MLTEQTEEVSAWRQRLQGKSVSDHFETLFSGMAETDKVHPNPEKDPDEWVTGDEPVTGPQKFYLKPLSQEAKEPFDENLTKAEASKRIEELQEKTGRGKGSEG